jgi:hypothetical protein
MPRALHELCFRTGERAPSCPGRDAPGSPVETWSCKYQAHPRPCWWRSDGQRIEAIHVVVGGGRAQPDPLPATATHLATGPVLAGPVETTSLGQPQAQALAGGSRAVGRGARPSSTQASAPMEYHPRDPAAGGHLPALPRAPRAPAYPRVSPPPPPPPTGWSSPPLPGAGSAPTRPFRRRDAPLRHRRRRAPAHETSTTRPSTRPRPGARLLLGQRHLPQRGYRSRSAAVRNGSRDGAPAGRARTPPPATADR